MRRIMQVQMTDHSVSSEWWRALVRHFVRAGDELEIRCWKEETAEIRQASFYGTSSPDRNEVSVKGTVTAGLLAELLSEEPVDKSVYNKMTKYFTISVKNERCNFCSEHYGTELYLEGVCEEDAAFFTETMNPYGGCFSIRIEES